MNVFERLWQFYERGHYGNLIMPVFELIAIIIGLRFVRNDKLGRLFLVYLTFDFLIYLANTYLEPFSSLTTRQVVLYHNISNNLISLVELLVYFYFFSTILNNKKIIKTMQISAMIFTLLMALLFIAVGYGFLTTRFSYLTNLIGTIEFMLLVPPCFVYYYELFQNDPVINLHQRPSFWIVTGIFFYAVISIPYYTLDSFVNNLHPRWRVTYLLFFCIPFAINFIFLTKAFLCKKKLTI